MNPASYALKDAVAFLYGVSFVVRKISEAKLEKKVEELHNGRTNKEELPTKV